LARSVVSAEMKWMFATAVVVGLVILLLANLDR
jgi:hypothetical protein